jgi:hypothetical protein
LRISTTVREQTPGELAWFVKAAIDGFARAFAPTFARMRLPPLYESGIVFAFEPFHGSGDEDFATPLETLERGAGDCDDLVIYRLCELYAPHVTFHTVNGARVPLSVDTRAASCTCEWVGESMHVQVRMKNGSIEDPAVLLGAPHAG